MGYLTTITLRNDALGEFEKNPELFGKTVLQGVHAASMAGKEVDMGFEGYCNYISVQPSRHADDETLYLHSGNTVFNINPYNKDMKELMENRPEIAEDFLKRAQKLLDDAVWQLKERKRKKLFTAAKSAVR